jgi:hypothetical protein
MAPDAAAIAGQSKPHQYHPSLVAHILGVNGQWTRDVGDLEGGSLLLVRGLVGVG